MAGIVIHNVSGMCPTQGTGTVDGLPWYYRSRHGEWSLTIAREADGDAISSQSPGWGWAGVDTFDGWVPPSVARKLIVELLGRPRDRWPQKPEAGDVIWIGEPWITPPTEPGDALEFIDEPLEDL